jgi:hypothetical protein
LLSEGVTRELMRKPQRVVKEGMLGEEEEVVVEGVVEVVLEDVVEAGVEAKGRWGGLRW